MSEDPRLDTVRQLSRQLRHIESQQAPSGKKTISSGIPALDHLLPGGGIERGTILEWLTSSAGSGAGTLAFKVAAQQMRDDGTLVVIDSRHSFYPPAAAHLGIDLARTVIARPHNTQDTLWALEQTLRCAGVAVAICHLDHLDDRVFRRLQLATETGGGIGLFIRPDRFRERPSWANVRLRVRGQMSEVGSQKKNISDLWPPAFGFSPHERLLQLELLRYRNNSDNKTILIGINDETGLVRLVSELAPATSLPRAARA
jgi:protein ImuA